MRARTPGVRKRRTRRSRTSIRLSARPACPAPAGASARWRPPPVPGCRRSCPGRSSSPGRERSSAVRNWPCPPATKSVMPRASSSRLSSYSASTASASAWVMASASSTNHCTSPAWSMTSRAPPERVGVEEPHGRFEQPDDRTGHGLRSGFRCSLPSTDSPGWRPSSASRGLPDTYGVQQRGAHRHCHALQHAEAHHAHGGQHAERQLGAGNAGQPHEGVPVEQAGRRQQQDGRQNGLRQPEKRPAEQAHDHGQRRRRLMLTSGDRAARHQSHGRARIGARHDEALEQSGGHVGRRSRPVRGSDRYARRCGPRSCGR